ncbi:DUF6415 family natural product biosynthesis protein [Streptomyces diastatochromogenes]|uniref:DUF6415 family natural product biosynthesis protein n=1 Tax=Streptomyces diastatochromogenes TaxID=42236 RepID=UPI0036ACA482
MSATARNVSGAAAVDLAAMRETAVLVLGSEARSHALPPTPMGLDAVTESLRKHLERLVVEVELKAARMPKDSVARYCAIACVGEAQRKLSAGPSPRFGGDIGHARRLARVLRALCEHYESAADTP